MIYYSVISFKYLEIPKDKIHSANTNIWVRWVIRQMVSFVIALTDTREGCLVLFCSDACFLQSVLKSANL